MVEHDINSGEGDSERFLRIEWIMKKPKDKLLDAVALLPRGAMTTGDRQYVSNLIEQASYEAVCDVLEPLAKSCRITDPVIWRSLCDACVKASLYERAAYYLDIAKGIATIDDRY